MQFDFRESFCGERRSSLSDSSKKRIKTIQIPSSLNCPDAVVPSTRYQSQKSSSTYKAVPGNGQSSNEPVEKIEIPVTVSSGAVNNSHKSDKEPLHNESVCKENSHEQLLMSNDALYGK